VVGKTGNPPTLREAPVLRAVAIHDTETIEGIDVALGQVDPYLMQGMPVAHLRDDDLEVDEALFMGAYGPDVKGRDRSPKEAFPYNEPGIIGGVVTLNPGNPAKPTNLVYVVTGLKKSYGLVPQQKVEKGWSGGGVEDLDSNLVGIVQSSTEVEGMDAPARYTDSLSDIFTGNNKVNYTLIQPVTKPLVNELKAKLAAAPPCERRQPKIVFGNP
jgi:hypothetical protein